MIKITKGAIIFYREGGRLFVMAYHHCMHLCMRKKFWSPPLPTGKNSGPTPLPMEKRSALPVKEHNSPLI